MPPLTFKDKAKDSPTPSEYAQIEKEDFISLESILDEEIAKVTKKQPIKEDSKVRLLDAVTSELGKHRNNLIDIKDDHSKHNRQMQTKQDEILRHMRGVTKLEKTLYILIGVVIGGIIVGNIEFIGRYVEPVGRVIKYLLEGN